MHVNYVGYFSIAVVKYHLQKQLKEERGLFFLTVSEMGPSWLVQKASSSRMEKQGDHILSQRKHRETEI